MRESEKTYNTVLAAGVVNVRCGVEEWCWEKEKVGVNGVGTKKKKKEGRGHSKENLARRGGTLNWVECYVERNVLRHNAGLRTLWSLHKEACRATPAGEKKKRGKSCNLVNVVVRHMSFTGRTTEWSAAMENWFLPFVVPNCTRSEGLAACQPAHYACVFAWLLLLFFFLMRNDLLKSVKKENCYAPR